MKENVNPKVELCYLKKPEPIFTRLGLRARVRR
jgi:hypothetical protein